MAEDDLEIVLEDEVNDEDVVILDDKGDVKKVVGGGMNDAYWNKCKSLFLPSLGIDGVLSTQSTITASIALLFECNDTLFFGSLFNRLRGAVVSGASVLTEKHLMDTSKRTAYYALTTMNGFGLFPRGFIFLCINLLGEDRVRIREALEPFKKISQSMKGHLTFISKCTEKRVGKNPELHAKINGMLEMTERYTVWQYPKMFKEVQEDKWPAFVQTAIEENEERIKGKKEIKKDENTHHDRYSKERAEKLKNKMAYVPRSHFWASNCKMWGMECEVEGEAVVNAAIKIVREINKLYGGDLTSKCRIVSKSRYAIDDKELFDPTRQHSLRFIELLERYSVFPKGVYILFLRAVIMDESVMDACVDLLGKIKDKVKEHIDLMVKLDAEYTPSGKSCEKDPSVCASAGRLRVLARDRIYPHLPALFGGLNCTRVPGFVAQWMKSSPMTKSTIKEWSEGMGVETDLNGFPLRTNEEFVMPEMGDEFMDETMEREEEKEKTRPGKRERKKKEEEKKEKEKLIGPANKKNKITVPSGTKPMSLLDQIIPNPFGPQPVPPPFHPMGPPPSGFFPSPMGSMGGPFGVPPPPGMMGPPPMGGGPPPFMLPPPAGMMPPQGVPPPFIPPRLQGLMDVTMNGEKKNEEKNGIMGREKKRGEMKEVDYVEMMRRKEEDEEKMKLERMARLMMGGGKEEKEEREERRGRERDDRGDRGEKRLSVEEEMIEREKRLQRWLEEKNGGRREERRREEERRGEERRRRRSRSRSRGRDGREEFERRVEELERKKREEKEDKERYMKEICVEHWRKVKGSCKPMEESKWEFRPEWGVTTVWRRVSGHSKWEEKVKERIELLDIRMNDFYMNNVQTPEQEQKKKIVWERLQDGMQAKLDGCGVFFLIAGSTPSSFATKNSNLDLVMISPVPNMTPHDIRHLFFNDLPFIISQRGGKVTREEELWMEFECTMSGVPLGVRIAIDAGAHYFSKIMTVYDRLDKRVSILLLYIKHWTSTHFRRPEDVSKYLLTTLVIHYLQCGVSPPVLPSLHLLYPTRLAPDAFSSFDYASPFEPPLPQCNNTQSPSSLLIGFFMYYASFDFSRYAISIRNGSVMRKRDIGVTVPDFAIEHPFDGSYTAVVNEPFTSSHFTAAMTAACQDAITNFEI